MPKVMSGRYCLFSGRSESGLLAGFRLPPVDPEYPHAHGSASMPLQNGIAGA